MARILLADDSETILLLLRTRLEMEGHEVETAVDGQEVVDAVRNAAAAPDVLLLDAMMPRKSGIDALRELRAAGVDTPALIVSAHTEGDNGNDRSDLSISGYIAKPIDFDRLFETIAELTGAGPAG
ncbi:MAG TPA: response regulator [Solirubrobacterales bacterium]